uniref:Uncharacterized protein n=1 Tax=Rhizophora mucronata TaxID=61149 RepID=A0A2P2J1W0_RHIMU
MKKLNMLYSHDYGSTNEIVFITSSFKSIAIVYEVHLKCLYWVSTTVITIK